jgi:stearoyl-CoA desaturase (delta-9 desaturase)
VITEKNQEQLIHPEIEVIENADSGKGIEWSTTLFFIFNPLVAVIGTILFAYFGFVGWQLILFAVIFAGFTNLSITAGYHRLYAHRSYETTPFVEWIYLLIGASAWQGSALKWCSDHRRHHMHIDTEKDPYNIQQGFWYAHMGWLFKKESVNQSIHAPDLEKNHRMQFQNRYYLALAIGTGYILPGLCTLAAYLCFADQVTALTALGYFWSGVIVAGSLRIFLTEQSTFFVNSLAHTLGKQPYSLDISAKDSLIVAILTHGEGYHNFHHKFQWDYRNAIKWYQWDPTKWIILSLKSLGLAKKLKEVSPIEIMKARLQVEAVKLSARGFSNERIERMKEQILAAQIRWKNLKADYQNFKTSNMKSADAKLQILKADLENAKRDFKTAFYQWKSLLKQSKAMN